MQAIQDSGVLQAENSQGEKGLNSDVRRDTICRVPANHTQAERKIIHLIAQGVLEIDDQGRIWKLQVRRGSRWGKSYFAPIPRKRAESRNQAGYLQVRITPEPEVPQIGAMAHRLIWHYLFGPIPDGMCINHKNGIKDDNRPGNLEIVTYSENIKHAHRLGCIDQSGERNPNAKLSNAKVQEIRILYSTGQYYQGDLAKKFGVSFQTISKIVRGERRGTQKGPIDSKDHRLDYIKRNPETGRIIGKKRAGRLLDGALHEEYPKVA